MADSDSFVLQIVCYIFCNRHVAWSQHELILPYTIIILIPCNNYPWIAIFMWIKPDKNHWGHWVLEPRFAACCAGELCAFVARAFEVPAPKARAIKVGTCGDGIWMIWGLKTYRKLPYLIWLEKMCIHSPAVGCLGFNEVLTHSHSHIYGGRSKTFPLKFSKRVCWELWVV